MIGSNYLGLATKDFVYSIKVSANQVFGNSNFLKQRF